MVDIIPSNRSRSSPDVSPLGTSGRLLNDISRFISNSESAPVATCFSVESFSLRHNKMQFLSPGSNLSHNSTESIIGVARLRLILEALVTNTLQKQQIKIPEHWAHLTNIPISQ